MLKPALLEMRPFELHCDERSNFYKFERSIKMLYTSIQLKIMKRRAQDLLSSHPRIHLVYCVPLAQHLQTLSLKPIVFKYRHHTCDALR